MRFAPTNAYVASASLADAWREFYAATAKAHMAIAQWEKAHPDAPRIGTQSRPWAYGRQVSCFMRDSTSDPVPDGFCKPPSRSPLALLPYEKKPSGKPWRDLLATVPRYPKFRYEEFGITDISIPNDERGWGSHWSVLPLFHDLDGTVYVTTAAEHPPTDHLTPVPLSVFYAAKEASDAMAS